MPKTKRLSDLDQRLLRYGDLKPFLVALRADLKTIRDRLDAVEAALASLPKVDEPAVAPTEGA